MTWIKTVSPEESPAVAQAMRDQAPLYPQEYMPESQAMMRLPELAANDSIVRSHSLIPGALRHAFSTFGELMNPDLPLTRRQHEMIATVVSGANECFYCCESHTEFLRLATLDEELAAAIKRGWRSVDLDE